MPPSVEILHLIKTIGDKYETTDDEIAKKIRLIISKLSSFGIDGEIVFVQKGALLDLFAFLLRTSIKVSKILSLESDLAMVLKSRNVRILAPIPGKNLIGFEVAKEKSAPIFFANNLRSGSWLENKKKLSLLIGQQNDGQLLIVSLIDMPHLLIAGSTGSGKSVCIHSLLSSLLFSHNPEELRLILIDPKRLEFAFYKDIPHLLFPIITDVEKAVSVLSWLVDNMMERYEIISQASCRDLDEYNKSTSADKMSYIVMIIDELADLIMVAGKKAEILLIRLGQMARAAGIHLIVATQRPSVDVVTGLIKVNFPTRIAFRVSSKIDSRVVVDVAGAEKLLGKGDMLFLHPAQRSIIRLTGSYISASEIERLTNYLRKAGQPDYVEINWEKNIDPLGGGSDHCDRDELHSKVVAFLVGREEISISLVQRQFGIGFNRAAKIIESLENDGLLGSAKNGKSRRIL